MLTNQEPDRNIEDLTETEIYDLIRYLEPNPPSASEMDGDGIKITVSSSAYAYTSHYWRASRSSGCIGDDLLFVCLRMLNVRPIALLNTFNRFVTRITRDRGGTL